MNGADKKIGNYRITKVLEQASPSAVCQAQHIALHRFVRVEAMDTQGNTKLSTALQDRAVQVAQLQHPAIGTLVEYIVEDTTHYFVTVYQAGVSLHEYLHTLSSPLPLPEATAIFNRILDAFVYLHKYGIAHGCLTSSSILLLPEGGVQVVGLGNLHWLAERGALATAEYSHKDLTTLPHATLPGKAGISADVYALGIILQRMVLGQPESFTREYPHGTPYIPNALSAIIRKAITKQIDERFGSAVSFWKAMQQLTLVNSESIHPAPSTKLSNTPSQERFRKPTAIPETFLLLLILLMIAAAGFAIKIKQPDSSSTHAPYDTNEPATQGNRADLSGEKDPISADQLPIIDSLAETNSGTADPVQEENAYIKSAIQAQMEEYYAALGAHDLSNLMQLFSPPLPRFFNERNVTASQLRNFLKQALQRTPEARHDIIWNTMRYGRDEAGNHLVDYWMYYHYHRARRNHWQKQIVFTQVKLNQDLKIISINGH